MKPNIIVFFSDQQRYDSTGVGGNPMKITPNFDFMATHGTHFANGFTTNPVCGPARACMQTGLYPTNANHHDNNGALLHSDKRLGKEMKEAGYTTAYIGKWHLSEQEPVPEKDRMEYDTFLGANILEFESDSYKGNLYDNDGKPFPLVGYRSDALVDAAINYIKQPKDNPFFLFLSFIEPHHQNSRDDYPAPDSRRTQFDKPIYSPPDLTTLGGTSARHLPGYYGMIKRLDDGLGRLMDALKTLSMQENTIIIYTSDHGCHFKTRNGEYKRSCHDSSIHVPMAAIGGPFTSGGRKEQMVSLVDIPPTIVDAGGGKVPEYMEGKSLLPLLNNPNPEWENEVFTQISESQIGRVIRTKRWKYSISDSFTQGTDGSYSPIYKEEFLYDLYADPWELENLIGCSDYEEVLEKLREKLLAKIKKVENRTAEIEVSKKFIYGRKVEDDELNIHGGWNVHYD